MSDELKEKFIVPFCEKCKKEHSKIITLELNTTICTAEKSKTCEKNIELWKEFQKNR